MGCCRSPGAGGTGVRRAGVGIGLAAVYLFPAIREQHWVDVRVATDDPGAMIESSWLFARHADPTMALHDVVLRVASIIAVAMIAVALGGLVVSWLRGDCRAVRTGGFRLG